MKAKIRIGYTEYVMDADEAVMVGKALLNAEKWDSKYVSASDSATGRDGYVYGVYRDQEQGLIGMELIPDDVYRIAKLRGKPGK